MLNSLVLCLMLLGGLSECTYPDTSHSDRCYKGSCSQKCDCGSNCSCDQIVIKQGNTKVTVAANSVSVIKFTKDGVVLKLKNARKKVKDFRAEHGPLQKRSVKPSNFSPCRDPRTCPFNQGK